MAMELDGEKVACDMAGASLATPEIDGAQHCVEEDRRAVPPLRICRLNGENGSQPTWLESGFFILAML
jgi:hypothetical protein